MKYIATELHCHTIHSDGNFDVATLMKKAVENGLELIALTDHNTISCYDELTDELQKELLPVIKGIEWTTFFGHALVLSCKEFVDWRKAEIENIDEYILQVKKNGGIFGLAHPFDLGSPMCTGGAFEFQIHDYSLVDFIEVWHEDFPSIKTPNKRTKAFWQSKLDEGYKIPLTYGKDWHTDCFESSPCGATYLLIDEKVNEESAVNAIKKGRTAISIAPKFILEGEKEGEKIYLGDTISKGKLTLHLHTDMTSRKEVWGQFDIEPQSIEIIGEKNTVIASLPFEENITREIEYNGKYLFASLSGKILNKNCEIAITSPIYLE